MTVKKAFLYLRASSKKQDRSIAGQRKDCYAYAKANNIVIIEEFEDTLSAYKTNVVREGFNNLLKACESGKADFVLVWALNRFTRQHKEGTIEILKLEIAGVNVISTQEGVFSSDNLGDIIQRDAATFSANKYIIDLKEAVKRGHRDARERGSTHGPAPYGLQIKRVKMGIKDRPTFVINEDEAPTILKIFTWYDSGVSLTEIIKRLNNSGAINRRGNPWLYASVQNVLRNPVYGGFQSPKTNRLDLRKCSIETFVPKDVWERVFYSIHNREKMTVAKTKHNSLTGIVKCSRCGRNAHTINGSPKYKRYRCKGIRDAHCDFRASVSFYKLEEAVLGFWNGLVSKKGKQRLIDRLIKAELDYQKNQMKSIQHLVDQKEELDSKIRNLMDLAESGQNIPDLAERIIQRSNERDAIEDQIKDSDVDYKALPVDVVRKEIEDMISTFDDVRKVAPHIDRIEIVDQNIVTIQAFGKTVTLEIPRN